MRTFLLTALCLSTIASVQAASGPPAGRVVATPAPLIPPPSQVIANPISITPLVPVSDEIQKWCSEARDAIAQLKWKIEPCKGIDWKVGGTSVKGRPLVYAEFGDPQATNITLVFSMVHGDEITPFYLAIQMAQWLKSQGTSLMNSRVVIAPLVNPDGFYHQPRTRVNANGVDINRNFNTEDWDTRAISLWKTKYKSDPRRNPGKEAGSEPETQFQRNLISEFSKFGPPKVASFHSPLNFLDYDGPGTISTPNLSSDYVRECLRLSKKLKAKSGGFFPGSLGNLGAHLGIPTFTIELRSTRSNEAEQYWKQVQRWIPTLFQYSMSNVTQGKRTSASGG